MAITIWDGKPSISVVVLTLVAEVLFDDLLGSPVVAVLS